MAALPKLAFSINSSIDSVFTYLIRSFFYPILHTPNTLLRSFVFATLLLLLLMFTPVFKNRSVYCFIDFHYCLFSSSFWFISPPVYYGVLCRIREIIVHELRIYEQKIVVFKCVCKPWCIVNKFRELLLVLYYLNVL